MVVREVVFLPGVDNLSCFKVDPAHKLRLLLDVDYAFEPLYGFRAIQILKFDDWNALVLPLFLDFVKLGQWHHDDDAKLRVVLEYLDKLFELLVENGLVGHWDALEDNHTTLFGQVRVLNDLCALCFLDCEAQDVDEGLVDVLDCL